MATILLALVITLFFFFPLSTYILFWYEMGNSDDRRELTRASEGKTIWWVFRGFFSSLLSQVFTVSAYPFGFAQRLWQPKPEGQDASPPVILIHGLYHNPSAWLFYRWWLRRAGYRRIYAFQYSSFNTTFWEIYDKFVGWMEERGRSFPGEDVILLGHSLGGLLGKAYTGRESRSEGPGVKTLITLGSPYKGSRLVVFGIGRLVQDLTYDGPLMGELAKISIPSEVACAALYSPVDNMVLPTGSLKAPPGWQEERTEPISHVTMLYHRPTFKRVLGLITTS